MTGDKLNQLPGPVWRGHAAHSKIFSPPPRELMTILAGEQMGATDLRLLLTTGAFGGAGCFNTRAKISTTKPASPATILDHSRLETFQGGIIRGTKNAMLSLSPSPAMDLPKVAKPF